jgi:hypothetical protein
MPNQNRYTLQELILEDLLSFFYHGTSSEGTPVLIWQYKPEFLTPGLIRELAESAKKLTHIQDPNILNMRDYYTDGKSFYTVHESVAEPMLLETFLKKNHSSPQLLWKLSSQVLKALLTLESKGIVWGGVNLGHLIVDRHHQIKLAKIALPLAVFRKHLQQFPVVEDCIFFPPEFIQRFDYDHRSDMYTFGMLLYIFFSHKWPYPYTSKLMVLKKALLNKPKPFVKVSPKIPDRLGQMIHTCLNHEPSARFENFLEMLSRYENEEVPGSLPYEKIDEIEPIRQELALSLKKERNGRWWKWLKYLFVGVGIGLILLVLNTFVDKAMNKHPLREMPNVVGLTEKEALMVLERNNLVGVVIGQRVSRTIGEGRIVESKPPAGREIRDSREVQLFISRGKGELLVPNVVGKTLEQAAKLLPGTATFNIAEEVFSYTHPKGYILSQTPSPNTTLDEGASISIMVSGGYPVSISTEASSGGTVTVMVYTAALKQGSPQAIDIQNQTQSGTTNLFSKVLSPGAQETHSFQVPKHSTIQVLYNRAVVAKEVIE